MADTAFGWRAELQHAVQFYTRFPTGWIGAGGPDGAAPGKPETPGFMRMVPVAGLIIGVAGGIVYIIAALIMDNGTAAGLLAVLATILASGALHEDGLADTADGLAGDTRERRLAIMRDSQVGTYGVLALIFSVAVRAALIGAIGAAAGALAAALTLAGMHAVARGFALWPAYCLTPARTDGAAVTFGRPDEKALREAALIALLIAFVTVASGPGILATILAILAAAAAAYLMGEFAERWIGGQTGDISGASEQICEIAFLVAIAATIST